MIEKDTYFDGLVTTGNNINEVRNVKKESGELFIKGVFFFVSGIPMCQLLIAIT